MKLYHGSNMEIDKPDLSRSKPFKDFGQGFYLSPGYEQAHALAKQKTDQLQSGEPCVTICSHQSVIVNGHTSIIVSQLWTRYTWFCFNARAFFESIGTR